MSTREKYFKLTRMLKVGVFAIVLLLICAWQGVAGLASGFAAKVNSPVVHTDGHLRPGHFETIWVKRFPGRGRTEATFFPTAICESKCGAVGRQGGLTDVHGAAKLRIRIPGSFLNSRGGRTYFRDRERIDLQVLWYGPSDDEFDVGSAEPWPVIVRTHQP